MSERLEVLLRGKHVGTIQRNRAGRMSFTYAPSYRDALALSPALPVSDRRFKDEEIGSFMDGLLPDNTDVRLRWARQFQVTDHPFDLLSHMGRDCAGAVQFAPPDKIEQVLAGEGEYLPLSDVEIGERLRQLRTSRAGETWTMPREHWSLAGAQSKFSLALHDGRWCEAHGTFATTHIIKPGVSTMRYQATVEFATMRVASRLGLPTARVELVDFDGERALVVTRFDRLRADTGGYRRLHQVDMCQATGTRPTQKYEFSGGPTAAQLAKLIERQSTDPQVDIRRFSDALLFNYLSGSPDGHAKNFGFLYAGRQVRLAPLYDLASGLPYDNAGAAPYSAFSIGGVRNFGEAYPKHWLRHARDMGLDPDERMDRMRYLAEALHDSFHAVLTEAVQADEGARLWRRFNEHPGRLGRHLRQMLKRL